MRTFFSAIAEMWRERNRVYDGYRFREKRQDEKVYYKLYLLVLRILPFVRSFG